MEHTLPVVSDEFARRIRRRNPDQSKKRILDAAEKAFGLRGFDGARLRDIAQEAGVHHALVHHYFSDKRGLYQEVLSRGLDRISGISTVRFTAGLPLRDNIKRLVDPLYDFFADNRHLLRAIEGGFRDRDAVPFAVAASILGDQGQPLVSRLESEITAAQARGEMRDDLPSKALILYGLSVLMTPFIVGSGFSQALSLPRPGNGVRDVAKAEVAALLEAAVSPIPKR